MTAPPLVLSPRLRQVLDLTCEGYTLPEIGRRLGIHIGTVRSHLERIAYQLDEPEVRRARIVSLAYQRGLIEREFLPPVVLPERQWEVLRHIAHGHTDREIGCALYMAVDTVKTHVKHILQSLGARSRVHAVALAHHTGLLGWWSW